MFTRRRLITAAVILLILIAAWLGSSIFVAYRLTHRRSPPTPEPNPSIDWGKPESLRLRTSDNLDLGAWFINHPGQGPSVILLHGNGGSRTMPMDLPKVYFDAGCAVLAVTLRAHGDSAGDINDFGYSARRDVLAAVEYLEIHRPGRPIIIRGSSLGAAAAIFAGPDLAHRVHAYILECPYRDLRTALRNRMRIHLPPVLDWIAYQGVVTVSPLVLDDPVAIAPIDYIARIPADIPILILAGGQDTRTTPDQIRDLQTRAGPHATLTIFDGAGHEELFANDPARYKQTVTGLIDAVTSGGHAPERSATAPQDTNTEGPK